MRGVKLAVILLSSFFRDSPSLLRRDIAGINLFKRLILALQRAGLEEFVVVSSNPTEKFQLWAQENITKDFRFIGKLIWLKETEEEKGETWNRIQSHVGSQNVLLIHGNTVTTANSIQDFIETSLKEEILDHGKIARLQGDKITSNNIFLFPPDQLEALKNYLADPAFQSSTEAISLDGPRHFAQMAENYPAARKAERELILLHKHYYRQFMDFWVNSFFSLRISSF